MIHDEREGQDRQRSPQDQPPLLGSPDGPGSPLAEGQIAEAPAAATGSGTRIDFLHLCEILPGAHLLVTADPDHVIVAANDQHCHDTKTRREDVLGRRLFDVLPDDTARHEANGADKLRASLARVVATCRVDRMPLQRYELRRPDGRFEERWWQPVNVPVPNPDGRVAHVLHTVEDVTAAVRERRLAEGALHASKARLARLLEATPAGIVELDGDGRFTYANPAAERMLGSGPGGLADLRYDDPAWQPTSQDGAPILPERLPAAWGLRGEQVLNYEQTVTTLDGRRATLLVDVVPVRGAPDGDHPHGRVEGALAAFQDVTGRQAQAKALRESEAQLLQAQKLETIGRLAAGVAHDFNNVLQGVAGGLELVLDDVRPGTPAHEFATIALGSARRGASLTQHLLSYARKQVLEPKLLQVGGLLSDMQPTLARTLGPHVAVELRIEPALPPVLVDPGQLETALLNLAINGAHAMPGGGTLRLAARRDGEDGERVVVAVGDTGAGMDEATLARVFEPFFTTKGAQGSGLGLSMVQGFAGQSGGEVRIGSVPGQGTTVELRLPTAQPPASSPGRRQGGLAEPLRGLGRVLLVEDAPDVLATAKAFLERAGFQVVQARSGSRALALLSSGEQRFDALVSDYAMPGINGVDLIRQARVIQPELPALLITGFAEVGGQEPLPEAMAVLRKPFQRSRLVEAVLHAVGQQASGTAHRP